MTGDRIDWSACPAAVSTPDVLSGAWRVRGTRIPVEALLVNAHHSAEGLAEMFHGLEREDAEAILRHAAADP